MAMGFIVTSETAQAAGVFTASIIMVEQVGPDLYDVIGSKKVDGEHVTRYAARKEAKSICNRLGIATTNLSI
jgi:hypothetical protein